MITAAVSQDHNKMDARVNTLKEESKQAIKPARYESSKITYYAEQKSSQTKHLEVFLMSADNYIFAFNGKDCSSKVTLSLYDLPADAKNRSQLKSVQLDGKQIIINSSELNEIYRNKVKEADRLRKVFVEYEIEKGSRNQEAIILVLGLK